MASDAVSQLRSDTQQAMEAHLANIEAQEGQGSSDPGKRERRRSEIMRRLEGAYALGRGEMMKAVARALKRNAEKERDSLLRDKQGFSAYRFAKNVAAIRSVGQQIADLGFQGEERLRELYVSLVLRIGKSG